MAVPFQQKFRRCAFKQNIRQYSTIFNFDSEYPAIPNFAQETDTGTLLSAFYSIAWQWSFCLFRRSDTQTNKQTDRQTDISVRI